MCKLSVNYYFCGNEMVFNHTWIAFVGLSHCGGIFAAVAYHTVVVALGVVFLSLFSAII